MTQPKLIKRRDVEFATKVIDAVEREKAITKPTQAQIDAATTAILGRINQPGQCSYGDIANASLTAAAAVSEPCGFIDGYFTQQHEINATIERCAQELEVAYGECNTLNLLHGAARLRALKDKP